MRQDLSIVIICKNEANNIDRSLSSVRDLVSDIVVYDSGSTDGTVRLVESMGVPVHQGAWLGFGPTRRAATMLAKNDWVFCLDADEFLSEVLVGELDQLELEPGTAWEVCLRNHIGRRYIRRGAWGNDYRIRLFNRHECNWNNALIHEKVVALQPISVGQLRGSIIHRAAKDINDYRQKLQQYAQLTAEMYWQNGRRASLIKRLGSPLLTFVKSYFGKLGFLEGGVGLKLSKALAGYTWKKYAALAALQRQGAGAPPKGKIQ